MKDVIILKKWLFRGWSQDWLRIIIVHMLNVVLLALTQDAVPILGSISDSTFPMPIYSPHDSDPRDDAQHLYGTLK